MASHRFTRRGGCPEQGRRVASNGENLLGVQAGLPPKRRVQAKRASCVGGSNSVVESQPSKLLVAGSIPVSRSILRSRLEPAADRRVARH